MLCDVRVLDIEGDGNTQVGVLLGVALEEASGRLVLNAGPLERNNTMKAIYAITILEIVENRPL